ADHSGGRPCLCLLVLGNGAGGRHTRLLRQQVSAGAEQMIRLEKVTKHYPTTSGLHYVLRNASVEIPARAQIGVLGRNGSGKSTLMRMLAGVDVPNQGRIVKWGSVSWPLGIASGVQGQMTGRENARFACRIQGL